MVGIVTSNSPHVGLPRGDCASIATERVRHVVTWKGNEDCHLLQGRPIKLRFHLKNAKLVDQVRFSQKLKDQYEQLLIETYRSLPMATGGAQMYLPGRGIKDQHVPAVQHRRDVLVERAQLVGQKGDPAAGFKGGGNPVVAPDGGRIVPAQTFLRLGLEAPRSCYVITMASMGMSFRGPHRSQSRQLVVHFF